MKETPVRVSISEASRLFGISEKSIRRAIRSEELRYIIVRNRYKLSFPSLVSWSQKSKSFQKKTETEGSGQWIDRWKIRNVKFSPREPK